MSAKSLLIGAIVGAAVGGGAAWAVLSPRAAELVSRIDELEAQVQDARHDAGEMKAVAEAERLRTESARRQLEELRAVRNAAMPPATMPHGAGGANGKAANGKGANGDAASGDAASGDAANGDGVTPKAALSGGATPNPAPTAPPLPDDPTEWTSENLDAAMTALARRPRFHRPNNPQFTRTLRGLEAQEDVTATVARFLASDDPAVRALVANLVGPTKRTELVDPIVETLAEETDLKARRSLLSALGKLPGDTQVDALVAAFEDRTEKADQTSRQIAVSALARRAHPVALKAVSGEVKEPPQVRVRAVEGLYARVRDSGWKDDAHVAVLCKVMENGDGDVQRGYAFAAVEGLWTKEGVAAAKALAANEEVAPLLRQRATAFVAGIEAGAERPEGAGEFDRKGMSRKKRGARRVPGPRPPRKPGTAPHVPKSPESPESPKAPESPDDGSGGD